jgi:ATP-binding cassette subfamily B (MDR/TAP) protein 1
MWFIIYCCYALAFWYGISLILEDRDKIDKDYTPAVLIIVLFGVLAGAQNLGFTAPYIEAFSTARGSAVSIFNVIDRIPEIDSLSDTGKKPRKIVGNIKFENVVFRYPAREDVQVLNGLNLEIEAGKNVALVGPSGCGKSTCLQLIQHLYNPLKGSVWVDGTKITELNTQHLRSFIGVVGQEPVLFATTIAENIRYGNPGVSQEEIEKAARIANCHQFIAKLPCGYDTKIGERGAQLSGGQKQRIAIARALVRNPKILLLDEATSALDPTSEKRVQDALERASKGRTTLVVSHRLSTITNCDKIVFINKGLVAEQGTHSELMAQKGLYFDLVNANNSSNTKDKKTPRPKRHSRRASVRSADSEDEPETDDEKQEEEEVTEEDMKKVSFLYLLKMNSKEWPYILTGVIASFVVGASFPVFAVLFGEMYGILSEDDPEDIQRQANFYSLLFLVLGLATGIGTFMQTYMFTFAGVRLTSRLRSMTFNAMMSQEMGWFDDSRNAVGALCARLAGDCAGVQGATGSRIGSIVQAASVIIIGIGVSFFYNVKMTLVACVTIPIVLTGIVMEARLVEKSNQKEKQAIENATKMAVEAISNIRTVASLGQEPHIIERYTKEIDEVHVYCQKKSRFRGFVFGLGQTVPLMGYGLSLWYGGTLVAKREMPYENVIK